VTSTLRILSCFALAATIVLFYTLLRDRSLDERSFAQELEGDTKAMSLEDAHNHHTVEQMLIYERTGRSSSSSKDLGL
jgi:hypothetical protein